MQEDSYATNAEFHSVYELVIDSRAAKFILDNFKHISNLANISEEFVERCAMEYIMYNSVKYHILERNDCAYLKGSDLDSIISSCLERSEMINLQLDVTTLILKKRG